MNSTIPPQLFDQINWDDVEAIVFDLGNVILDLNNAIYGKSWPHAIASNYKGLQEYLEKSTLFLDYESGRISSEEFLSIFRKKTDLSDQEIKVFWNSILMTIQPQRYELLQKLGERWPLYVLSNTNEIHIDWVRDYVANAGYPDFEQRFFKHLYYSYEIGEVKPNTGAYEAVTKGTGIAPENLLFIDDKEENILAARHLGWQAVHLPVGVPTEKVFDRAPL